MPWEFREGENYTQELLRRIEALEKTVKEINPDNRIDAHVKFLALLDQETRVKFEIVNKRLSVLEGGN